MVQELVGLAGETAGGGEGKVSGNEEVGEIFVGDFAGNGAVVAGGEKEPWTLRKTRDVEPLNQRRIDTPFTICYSL